MVDCERTKLLRKIQELCFAVHESELYLDTHPNDKDAAVYRSGVMAEVEKLTKEYENKFGPLTVRAAEMCGGEWNWLSDPWPWEYEANA